MTSQEYIDEGDTACFKEPLELREKLQANQQSDYNGTKVSTDVMEGLKGTPNPAWVEASYRK
jgi:hypothetical protein